MKTRVAVDLQKMSELVCPLGGGAVGAAYLGFADSGERVAALPYELVQLMPPQGGPLLYSTRFWCAKRVLPAPR